jgi:hypothetical protein
MPGHRLWMIVLVLAFGTEVQATEAKRVAQAGDLRLSISLAYGKDPEDKDNPQPVLLEEAVFRNTGKARLVFSRYLLRYYLESIEPADAYAQERLPPPEDKVRPPRADDVARLGPGETLVLRSWAWPYARFPFYGKGKNGVVISYVLKRDARIRVRLCADLVDHGPSMRKFLKPGEAFLVGTVCADPFEFGYRILLSED